MATNLSYETLLSVAADIEIENALKKYRKEQLQVKVDQALDQKDAEAFYQYSAELKTYREEVGA